jgi:sporulation protein YlmC with PRC-barrel domain
MGRLRFSTDIAPVRSALLLIRTNSGPYADQINPWEIDMTTLSGHTAAIRAKKVIDTKVKDLEGNTIGEVEDIVLDKLSNNIMFAVVGFGGFLGVGEKYHPIPWDLLDYDEADGAYVIGLTKEELKAAPADSIEELTRDAGTAYRDRAFEYYQTPRYWDKTSN